MPLTIRNPEQPLSNQTNPHAQMEMLMTLLKMPVVDTIGVCCSLLLQYSYDHPEVLRRVLNERVVREGFSGVSLLTVLKRAAE